MELDVCVVTTSVTWSRVTPGVMLPKYLPVIVMVGGLIARSALADVMTGVTAAAAGAAPNIQVHR
jgi:hypothetical protein